MESVEKMAGDKVEYIYDVMLETHTRTEDWLIGPKAISLAMHVGIQRVERMLQAGKAPTFRRVMSFNKKESIAIQRKDLGVWMNALTLFEDEIFKETPPAPVALPANGSAPKTITLSNAQPVLAHTDAEAIKNALWGVRTGDEQVVKALQANTAALDTNTAAVKHQTEEMKRIFDSQK